MSGFRTRLRGWGWIGWVVVIEVVLLGVQAVPTYLPVPAAVVAEKQAGSATVTPERASLQPILDFQPFGQAAAPAAAPEPSAASAAPASDGLVLQGVLWRSDATASRALVSNGGSTARIYTTGDVLPGGGTLTGIEVDRIWIDLDGQKRTLEFLVPRTATPAQDQPSDKTASAETDAPAQAPAVTTKAPSLPQPDLRHLIPGLVADKAP